MTHIRIEWITDEHHCSTCGTSRATGARVYIDNEHAFDLSPRAACYDGESFSEIDVYQAIFSHLNYTIED